MRKSKIQKVMVNFQKRKHVTSRGLQTLREGPETQTEFKSKSISNLLTWVGLL